MPTPVVKWSQTYSPPNGNLYYLNGNIDEGAVLAGQIDYGARQIAVDGTQLVAVQIPNTTASKSVVRVGDYYFVAGDDGQGVGRLDATGASAWDLSTWAGYVNPGATAPESICTDGTLIYANDDVNRNRIHAYSVSNSASSFTLTEEWSVDLPAGGRVRGLSYDAASGYLYMHNGGNSAADTSLYAINVDTQAVSLMGTHTEGARTYQALRYGDALLVAGQSDMVTVYAMLNDTTIFPAALDQLGVPGLIGDIYGMAVVPGADAATTNFDTLFIASSGGRLTAVELVPEPATLSLLGLGALALVRRRRTR